PRGGLARVSSAAGSRSRWSSARAASTRYPDAARATSSDTTADGGGAAPRDAARQRPDGREPGSRIPMRILIAEDETIIRLDLRDLLEKSGFEVVAEARDGE